MAKNIKNLSSYVKDFLFKKTKGLNRAKEKFFIFTSYSLSLGKQA